MKPKLTLARASFHPLPGILHGLTLVAALVWFAIPAGAASRFWLGSDSALWSDPDNWSPFGVPQNGDSLTFASPGFSGSSINNDLVNLSLNTITFTAGGYSLNGNALTFTQGITDNHSGAINRVRCDIQFSGSIGRFNSLDVGQLEITGTTTLVNNQDVIITASITNIIVSGAIVGSGGLVKRGNGALFLRGSANNNYTGPTRLEGGAVHLAKTSAARAISANVILDGALWRSGFLDEVPSLSDDLPGQYPPALSMVITNSGDWHLTNGATVTHLFLDNGFVFGSGLLNLEGDVTAQDSCRVFCSLNLGNQSRTFKVNRARISESLEIHGNIIGPLGPNVSGIIKEGIGQLFLKKQNTYLGPTLLRKGTIVVQHGGALGASGAGGETRLQESLGEASLTFDGTFTCPETIVAEAPSASINFFGNITLTGPLTVAAFSTYLFGTDASDRLEIRGVIDGTGGLVVRNGTVRISGTAPNTFVGQVDVAPRLGFARPTMLELAKPDNVVAVPGGVLIAGDGVGSTNVVVLRNFQANGVHDVAITDGGAWELNGHVVAPRSLTFNGPGHVETGSGQLQLGAPGASTVLDVASGSLGRAEIFGRIAFLSPTFDIAISAISTLAIHAQMSGAASLRQQAHLSGELGGTLILDGDNQFTGPFMVEAGQLHIKSTTALGSGGAGTFVNNNASLALEGRIDVADETLTLDSTNAAALASLGPETNAWSGNIILQRTAGIRVPDARGALTHSGIPGFGTPSPNISGPGGLNKSGPGTLFIGGLSRGNSYTGPTTVTGGLLEATRGGQSLSSNILVSGANSVLRTGPAGGIFAARTVLPVGTSMTVQDGAQWTMKATNFETLSRLQGDGRLEIGSGAALTLSNSVSCGFSGQISGSGALNKFGLATLHFTGQSPAYTGPATVFDGTYKVDGYFANSPVTVKLSSILRGSGAVGDVTVENGGVVRIDPRNAGVLGGSMQFNSVNFQNGGVMGLAFFGPHPTAGNDSLFVLNAVTLTSPSLSSGFNYPPREGDVITLIDKFGAGAVSGAIGGFPEGAVRLIGSIPVVTSYVGGDGNDVTLTVTNLPLRAGGSQLVSSSSGNILLPDDCSQLRLVVTNRSSTTVTNLRGTLRSLTDGVVVTIAESAFPNLAPNARGTNVTPFQIRTVPGFSCGAGAEFELVLTASNAPPIALVYTFVGTPGYSLQLDGRDARVDIPANTFSGVVNNFTIELWANATGNRNVSPETNAGISVLLARPNQRFAVFPDRGDLAYGATHVSAGLSIGRNGISAFEHGTNRLLGTIHLPSRLVYSNALSGWTHVALVYGSRQPRLYVNGALVRSGAASLFSSVHPSGSLGGSIQANFGNFEGQLDEVRIWNTALDPSQIQTNMTRRLTGTEPNLVTYFRADEGGGVLLTDSAPASPNPSGALLNGAAFALAGSAPITPSDADCLFRGGACESCFVVTGTFTTNTPTLTELLSAEGSPSLCFPTRACPGPFNLPNLPPTRYRQHSFTNTGGSDACVTAQLHFDCPAAPSGALHVAAYLGTFDGSACANYLGDPGGDSTAPFSFRVPPRTNIVLVVTLRVGDIGCDNYALELFGLPCPPPRLDIAKDTAPNKVRLQWSSAYPDYRLQSVNSLNGPGPYPFGNVGTAPVLVNGKFSVTNSTTAPRQFFRLEAR